MLQWGIEPLNSKKIPSAETKGMLSISFEELTLQRSYSSQHSDKNKRGFCLHKHCLHGEQVPNI